jgi:hypothetical protein
MKLIYRSGILAIILSSRELQAIDNGKSSAAGRNMAKGALILGIESGILLLVILMVVIFAVVF